MDKHRIMWSILLIIATVFFITGLYQQSFWTSICALISALVIKRQGYDVMFQNYDYQIEQKQKLFRTMKNKIVEGDRNE